MQEKGMDAASSPHMAAAERQTEQTQSWLAMKFNLT